MNSDEATKIILASQDSFLVAREIMAKQAARVAEDVCEKAGKDPAFTKIFFDLLKTVKEEDVDESFQEFAD